jgi:hypothetical protein
VIRLEEMAETRSAIVTPGKRRTTPSGEPIALQRSAIIEAKKPRNSMLAHLLDDITPEEHRRRSELADELFRTIVRRASKSD